MQVYENTVKQRWTSSVLKLGASAEAIEVSWQVINSMYNWPPRAYHNLDHIQDCLDVLDGSPFANSYDIEAALILHDIIYIPTRKDNEERSADLADFILQNLLEVHFENALHIQELIRATTHNNEYLTMTQRVICDIDLSILGRSPEEYEKYSRNIRAEYKQYTDEEYNKGRTLFLEKMLSSSDIFHVPVFREKYGNQAVLNMGRELASLRPAKQL